MNVTLDKHGHILKPSRGRLGDSPLATCLKCGRTFEEPLENFDREECDPKNGVALKLFLDDERSTPIGYSLRAKTVEECISWLQARVVNHVSLDHDLDGEHYEFQFTKQKENPDAPWPRAEMKVPTGFAVLEWMHANDAWVPEVQIHSLSTGVKDMLAFCRKNAPEWVEFTRVKPREI